LRLILSVALAAGLLTVVPATAPAASGGATVFTHSAESGQLRGGLLTLRGVGSRLTWAHNGGRSGTVSVERLHRRLFFPETPPMGTLHVAGRRPQALRLRRPRYNATRELVRYRVQRLGKRTRAGRVAGASQVSGEFGAASLSIVAHPSLLGSSDGAGNYCAVGILNLTIHDVRAASASKWDTDDWDPAIPTNDVIEPLGGTASWASQGGFLRGCSNTAVWVVDSDPPVSFTITTTHPFPGNKAESCKPSSRSFTCAQTLGIDEVNWIIRPTL
jgi:hypothetical protein